MTRRTAPAKTRSSCTLFLDGKLSSFRNGSRNPAGTNDSVALGKLNSLARLRTREALGFFTTASTPAHRFSSKPSGGVSAADRYQSAKLGWIAIVCLLKSVVARQAAHDRDNPNLPN